MIIPGPKIARRMFKKAVHFTHPPQARQDAPLPEQGHSERGGEAYSLYVAFPSDARTRLAAFFNILLQLQERADGRHKYIRGRIVHCMRCPGNDGQLTVRQKPAHLLGPMLWHDGIIFSADNESRG